MSKRTVLLHTCCAPCISSVQERLESEYAVVSFYYNPNIAPAAEYRRRLEELRRFSLIKQFPLVEGCYSSREWISAVKAHRFQGERSPRCWACYRLRLAETFRQAIKMDIDLVTTVLSVSPHKDASMINQIGHDLAKEFGIEFLESDFKKKGGFLRSVELSREYGFYRQAYCGCVYSMNGLYNSGVR